MENNLKTIEEMREIVAGAPDEAINWWPYRNCYAKETENNPVFCPFVGIEDRTSTPIFENGLWSTHYSQGFPNLVSLESMRLAITNHDTKPCHHGYDVACLICGFGTKDGKRVWNQNKTSDCRQD